MAPSLQVVQLAVAISVARGLGPRIQPEYLNAAQAQGENGDSAHRAASHKTEQQRDNRELHFAEIGASGETHVRVGGPDVTAREEARVDGSVARIELGANVYQNTKAQKKELDEKVRELVSYVKELQGKFEFDPDPETGNAGGFKTITWNGNKLRHDWVVKL